MNAIGADNDLLVGFTGKSLRGGGSSALTAAGHSDANMLNSIGHVYMPPISTIRLGQRRRTTMRWGQV